MVLLIDNYDSFSYNLYQAVGAVREDVKVVRNDSLSVAEIEELGAERIILSPGPGKPRDAGVCVDVVKELYAKVPILGICLGHQAIFEAFGGTVSYAMRQMHGKSGEATVDAKCPVFADLPPFVQVGRYHSLAGLKETLPPDLEITAQTDDGEIMGVRHKKFPVYGLQFHPESILTPMGQKIIENFLGVNYA
jgi:anthranilate synthase component 2